MVWCYTSCGCMGVSYVSVLRLPWRKHGPFGSSALFWPLLPFHCASCSVGCGADGSTLRGGRATGGGCKTSMQWQPGDTTKVMTLMLRTTVLCWGTSRPSLVPLRVSSRLYMRQNPACNSILLIKLCSSVPVSLYNYEFYQNPFL